MTEKTPDAAAKPTREVWLARVRILLAISALIVAADQLSKFLAVKHLTPGLQGKSGVVDELGEFYFGQPHPCRGREHTCATKTVIEGFWQHDYAENPGAAWSFLARAPEWVRRPFFVSVSLLAVLLIPFYLKSVDPRQKLLFFALALVHGGAFGNLIDRARLGYVIDFIVWWIGSYRWPTFNVADSAISVGAVLLLLDSILTRPAKSAAPEAAKAA